MAQDEGSKTGNLQELAAIVTALVAPDGCPWDKEQTPLSLCEYVLEEAHELVDAIRHGTDSDVAEELGDVLFLLVFISLLLQKEGKPALPEAVSLSAAKMIRRHPHVFADTVFDSKEEQLAEWERIKRAEKPDAEGKPAGVYDSLPKGLPPLTKAYRIHSKAARAGFTWSSDEDVELQVEAEWLELIESLRSTDKAAQERELGDIMFTLVELGRRYGIKASAALDSTNNRFLKRFACMEAEAGKAGKEFSGLDMEEKNALWDLAKSREKDEAPQESTLS